jgi:hypothetical protein
MDLCVVEGAFLMTTLLRILPIMLTGCITPDLDHSMERVMRFGGALYYTCDLPEFDHCRVRPGTR